MATMKAALQAKEKTKELLKDVPGIDGIGITWDDDGQPCVRVNIDIEEERSRRQIPASVDGVPIKVEFVRQARLE